MSALKIAAAAAAGILILAAATLALLELWSALVHLLGAFLYAFSGDVT